MITKPQPGEYNPQLPGGYLKLINDDEDILTVLEQQRDFSYKLFSSLSDEQADYRYAEGKWSIKEMIGHLIDTERIFACRALCFSREQQELPGFDQDVMCTMAPMAPAASNRLLMNLKLCATPICTSSAPLRRSRKCVPA